MPTTIYSEQFFNRHLAGSLASARIVLKELFDVASIKSVIDVGCGLGAWLRAAKECGADKVIGLDGDYVDHTQLLIEPSCFRCCNIEIEDLRGATAGHIPFDVAISMEVAEHLPLDRARSFVTELCSLSDLVLFSAAIPGQGGSTTSMSSGRIIGLVFFPTTALHVSTYCGRVFGSVKSVSGGTGRTRCCSPGETRMRSQLLRAWVRQPGRRWRWCIPP